jgi:hypothetical protein
MLLGKGVQIRPADSFHRQIRDFLDGVRSIRPLPTKSTLRDGWPEEQVIRIQRQIELIEISTLSAFRARVVNGFCGRWFDLCGFLGKIGT